MEEEVLKTIRKYKLINNEDKIVIGVSGGPDSICLLNCLKNLQSKIKFSIIVAHINHGLRKEADEETQYVQNMCNNLEIKCYVKKIDINKVAKQSKLGTEETGRIERYRFFNEILEKEAANKIATAHNLNDNAETVLMNIIRGTRNFAD